MSLSRQIPASMWGDYAQTCEDEREQFVAKAKISPLFCGFSGNWMIWRMFYDQFLTRGDLFSCLCLFVGQEHEQQYSYLISLNKSGFHRCLTCHY